MPALPPLSHGNQEDGYRLWLRYPRVTDPARLAEYRRSLRQLLIEPGGSTWQVAREELQLGLRGMLGIELPEVRELTEDGTVVFGTQQSSSRIRELDWESELVSLGPEGFLVRAAMVRGKESLVIASAGERGLLYGIFAWLRQLGTERETSGLELRQSPRIQRRMLNHWDNLDRTVERGYAGFSLWDWHELPHYLEPRYRDYARANASLGINGMVLTNVNATAWVLSEPYLEKLAALAEVFRPYGLRVYLTARFSAPVELGGVGTADPLDPLVVAWWHEKVAALYQRVPDFGGFLVKANSEGQPGPGDYGRTHAEGANLLADALAPHGGVVIWRAFVYESTVPEDRAKQAYCEFVPLDGRFRDNVLLQVKNGPIDFQPREPFHPLFGAMPRTALAAEFQLTQEYLGFATHLAYLGPLIKETLDSETYARGRGSTVARVVDGSLQSHGQSAMAGVSNIGTERNWCGHPFAQANWYAFGRLAWDHQLSAESVAEEWLRLTFSNDPAFLEPAKAMLLRSREAVVGYMTPLGLHHLMAEGHHYGPAPWHGTGRPDWTNVYFHRADRVGLGFDRSPNGSDATSQYAAPWRRLWSNLSTCPESLLLWFHHVPWDHRMRSGRTLWEELGHQYQSGVDTVRWLRNTWDSLESLVDPARFAQVRALLAIQEQEACWWRDACLLYFQTFSEQPWPAGVEAPARTLEQYQAIRHRYVPGI